MIVSEEFMNIEAYLFDLDGTLAANEKLKGTALAKTCHVLGAEATSALYKEVMGQRWEFVRQYFCEKTRISPQAKQFDNLFRGFYKDLLATQLIATAGAAELIQLLKKKQKKIAVVSSASKWMVEGILAQLGLTDFFDLQISQEDVSKHKPHPAAYLLAIEKLAVKPEDALIFEDSEPGIQAGLGAGCRVIAIRHEFNVKQNLQRASEVIDDFHEYLRTI